jgi:Tfp pilus assembly protein PilF
VNPRHADLLVLAAGASAAARDFATAEQRLRQALEVDPTALRAYSMLGRLYLRDGRLDKAKAEFETLAQRQTRPVAALTMLGVIDQAQGNTQSARERFERVLGLDPRAPIASNNLAWMYAESGGSLDIALQLAQTAAAGLPKSAEVLDTLGWIYYKKRLTTQAVATFSETIENDPKTPVYRYHLGLAYMQLGDVARARESLQRALALSPTFAGAEDARRALADLAVRGS